MALSLRGCSYTVNSTLNPDPYFLANREASRGNYDAADKIWADLSKSGDCDADWQLGIAYFIGRGVPEDTGRAVALWTSAADRGQPRAQIALADIYLRNPNTRLVCSMECGGLAVDPVQSYTWYLIAQRNVWYRDDKEYLGRALPHMSDFVTEEQRALAATAAASWKPTPADCKPRKAL